ncbi:hypothetical protein [Streptomyces sp. NPDC001165]|uniref:hypothetical protein n=1 Tax=Streptomyces sp. NPDC001165 TaxID=3364546 RepID=UPI0036CC9531
MTTDSTEHPVQPEVPQAQGAAEVLSSDPSPDQTHHPRRRIALLAGGAALLLAAVAGVGWTAVVVHEAEHDPGAATWRLPKASADKPAKAQGTGLSAMLLPYGEDRYGRGPDLAGFGSDAELSGRQATALRKESLAELPRSQRRSLERQIDRNPVKGMAMRSYLSTVQVSDSEASSGGVFTLQIVLSQMADRRIVRSMTTFQQEFFSAMKIFRKGPAIEGHKNAACFLPPTDSGEKLDMMVCSGYVGDVLVTATATSAGPLDKKGVAEMLAAQLNRIKDPGKAV